MKNSSFNISLAFPFAARLKEIKDACICKDVLRTFAIHLYKSS